MRNMHGVRQFLGTIDASPRSIGTADVDILGDASDSAAVDFHNYDATTRRAS